MIRFGILGTARIARAFLGYPLKGVEISAVASREQHRAEQFAGEWNIPLSFGSYDELLAQPSIDAVYIPLPPHLHCEYTVKAAEAGKHVLVEKPFARSADEAEMMIASSRDHRVLLMEAFMYRFMAIHRRVKEIVEEGTIGQLRYINFNFCFDIVTRGRTGFRTREEFGGGALYDLGVYAVDFVRFVTGKEPQLRSAFTKRSESAGVDEFTHAIYLIENVVATVTCSFNADANYYVLSGSKGSLTSPVAVSGRSLPNRLRVHLLDGDKRYEEEFPAENPYAAEIEYFAKCITSGEDPFLNGSNSLANMKLIDELRHQSHPLTI